MEDHGASSCECDSLNFYKWCPLSIQLRWIDLYKKVGVNGKNPEWTELNGKKTNSGKEGRIVLLLFPVNVVNLLYLSN